VIDSVVANGSPKALDATPNLWNAAAASIALQDLITLSANLKVSFMSNLNIEA
jgi:hypothetical protein